MPELHCPTAAYLILCFCKILNKYCSFFFFLCEGLNICFKEFLVGLEYEAPWRMVAWWRVSSKCRTRRLPCTRCLILQAQDQVAGEVLASCPPVTPVLAAPGFVCTARGQQPSAVSLPCPQDVGAQGLCIKRPHKSGGMKCFTLWWVTQGGLGFADVAGFVCVQ